jgi:YtkA-like
MTRLVALLVVTALAAATAAGAASVTTAHVVSGKRLFSADVTYPSPLPVERLHIWTVRLFDRRHHPVTHARIKVSGDMPEHGHGLPTSPVAVERGKGFYRLTGMMFQMPGRWYVQLKVRSAQRLDTIRVRFTIPE